MTARLRAAGLAVLPLTALVLLSPTAQATVSAPAAAPPAAAAWRAVPAPAHELRATTSPRTTVVPQERTGPRVAGATFRVSYHGFTPAARSAFQRAVDSWASQITSTVPITVRASFKPLGARTLGSAGPSLIWETAADRTLYVDAVANKLAGGQLDASPDIVADFNSSFSNWHFRTTAAPDGTYDFQTVVMHELGHGLGFLGGGRILSSGAGALRLGSSSFEYDQAVENGSGRSLLTFADPSSALATQLTSGRLFFDNAAVRTANGGRPAKLYAPATFQPGSSYSHLDEAAFPAGNAHSLMTPQLGDGETVRGPGAITRAIFRTIGW